jgi:hypothetical protein
MTVYPPATLAGVYPPATVHEQAGTVPESIRAAMRKVQDKLKRQEEK